MQPRRYAWAESVRRFHQQRRQEAYYEAYLRANRTWIQDYARQHKKRRPGRPAPPPLILP